ncbi:class I SAM-dependent methyltransferase [Allokutzneria sp. NRRL B-24872]|uniref:class I SAM-dependent methyltransferase n=2 Tax=Actinomycetes TaxID=1760 RepID=UPI001FEE1FAB|nr:class I SAM-dependent methyltransferase [Allokutzneria sp. NRRL B-24872]
MAEHRRALLAGLTGTVLEIGAGNGLDFGLCPATVTRVVAVEPEPRLRGLARTTATQTPVLIEVIGGPAECLSAADGAVDAVVASQVLCSVRDEGVALREIHRILAPGATYRKSRRQLSKPSPPSITPNNLTRHQCTPCGHQT